MTLRLQQQPFLKTPCRKKQSWEDNRCEKLEAKSLLLPRMRSVRSMLKKWEELRQAEPRETHRMASREAAVAPSNTAKEFPRL